MKIALAFVGCILILGGPLLWAFAGLSGGWAFIIAVIGFLTIPSENAND